MNVPTHAPPTSAKRNGAARPAPAPSGLAALTSELGAAFPERGAIIHATLTAAVAGEHVFVLGPPGTAKSLLVRSLAGAFAMSYFELLMTKFTEPGEVFGPTKLSALQQDRQARALAGYLATSEIVFLDEVFKANSAILNALLTALNERKFHDDGRAIDIPLVTCVGASNELPEGPELDALHDRFLVRVVTQYIQDDDAFRGMLTAAAPTIASRVDLRAEQARARAVHVDAATIDALIAVRKAAKAENIIASDRRWRQCVGLLRAAAHVDGRTSTEADDLETLEHVLWRKPDERAAVAKVIQQTVNPSGAKAIADLDSARGVLKSCPDGTDPTHLSAIGPAVRNIEEIALRVAKLGATRKVTSAAEEIATIQREIQKRAMRAAGMKV